MCQTNPSSSAVVLSLRFAEGGARGALSFQQAPRVKFPSSESLELYSNLAIPARSSYSLSPPYSPNYTFFLVETWRISSRARLWQPSLQTKHTLCRGFTTLPRTAACSFSPKSGRWAPAPACTAEALGFSEASSHPQSPCTHPSRGSHPANLS